MKDVLFTSEAFAQMLELQKSEPDSFKKLLKLIEITSKTPFDGLGKPEPLKYNYSGFWSRRITDKHRMVYEILENHIRIIECKDHYNF